MRLRPVCHIQRTGITLGERNPSQERMWIYHFQNPLTSHGDPTVLSTLRQSSYQTENDQRLTVGYGWTSTSARTRSR
ncbi:unnamed protein product [Arctogadus glacialis]